MRTILLLLLIVGTSALVVFQEIPARGVTDQAKANIEASRTKAIQKNLSLQFDVHTNDLIPGYSIHVFKSGAVTVGLSNWSEFVRFNISLTNDGPEFFQVFSCP